MRSRTKRVAGLALGCLVVLAGGGFALKAKGGGADGKAAVPAEQVIASIRTAVAARPGSVRAVEAEMEDGKTICEVEILAEDGKTYEVAVDVATNAVVEDND